MDKKYEIGEKIFIQKHLVWGQAKQLIAEIEGVELPASYTVNDILKLFEAKLPKLISIVLIPEGETARSKKNEEMQEFFEWELRLEQIVEIIEDFFDCNPIPSWLEKMGNRMSGMTNDFGKSSEREVGSIETLQSLQEVILQNETT